jgi:hypothetical protein
MSDSLSAVASVLGAVLSERLTASQTRWPRRRAGLGGWHGPK